MSEIEAFKGGLEKFEIHYKERLGRDETHAVENVDNVKERFAVESPKLRAGNYPKIFHHDRRTKDVVVLTHGLTDSPYYMQAIGMRFYAEGANVVLPLLPAHGLKDPDEAMEDYKLDAKWKEEIDNAVDVAQMLGDRISLGGFSTGAALSLNKVLRHPDKIEGGLFLFSAALDLGIVKEEAGRLRFLQAITKITDGKVKGTGPNPYKYLEMPSFAGIELTQIIRENVKLSEGRKISQGVFAAHSVHDTTVKIEGIFELLENHVENGVAFIISENVSHANLVLAEKITLNDIQGAESEEEPQANPKFDWMMDDAIRFFKEYVEKE